MNGVSVLPGNGDTWSAFVTAWTFDSSVNLHHEDSSGKHMGSKAVLNIRFVVICCHLLSLCRTGGLIPTCIQDSALTMAGECSWTPRLWRVCGGQGKGGILVRRGAGRVWKSGSEADNRITNRQQRNSNQQSTNVTYIKIRR